MQNLLKDKKELKDFYNLNVSKIYRYFFYKFQNKEIAEDLTGETFTEFIKMLKLEHKVDNYSSFLYGIAKNIFLKHLKEKYAFKSVNESELEFELEDKPEVENTQDDDPSLEEKLKFYLDQVPEKQREVLQMRLIDKLSLDEIATKLKKDMNHVKTTQKRALKTIKNIIKNT